MNFAKYAQNVIDYLFPQSPLVEVFEKLPAEAMLNELPHAEISKKEPWINSLFEYRNPTTEMLVKEMKYYHNKIITSHFSLITEQALIKLSQKIGKALLPEEIALIPIPPRAERLKTYGYDQNAFLFSFFSDTLKKCVREKVLLRKKDTSSFSKLNRKERAALSKNLFGVKISQPLPPIIILYDDVTTTHSTLIDARKALKEAGILEENIYAITVAKSGN